MTAYMIIEIDFQDMGWVEDYVAKVPPIIAQYGGTPVGVSTVVERIEGNRPAPQNVTLFSFPSVNDIKAFMESEEYKPYLEARLGGSTAEILAIEV